MLKNFLYLDSDALSQYVSQVEDGLRGRREATVGITNEKKGQLGPPAANISATGGTARTSRTEAADTPEAQFERLTLLVSGDADEYDWMTVVDPDTDLPAARVGTFVDTEAEVHIPQMLKVLASGGLGEFTNTLSGFAALSNALGQQVPNMPSGDQLSIMASVASQLQASQAFIGEPDSDTWRVAGLLKDSAMRTEIEGPAHVVGKVAQVVPADRFKQLLSLPGMNLISRQQRREMERKGPKKPDDETWIKGPALLLDVLAIYR